jgi:spore coat protein U-like protein
MKRLLALSTFFLAAGVIVLTPASASAQTNTSTLTVTATVVPSCQVAAVPLAFGNYSGALVDTVDTTIDVTCNTATDHWVGLDGGSNNNGNRRMLDTVSGDFLTYELYRDAGRTVIWDDTVAQGALYTYVNAASSSSDVYGSIPQNQIVAEGSYQDDVLVTVNF